jgi:hypothetical protein
MKLPWISTRAYEIMHDVAKGLAADVKALREENAALVATIVQMKRENFHPVAAVPAQSERPEDLLPRPVVDALDELGLIGKQRSQHEAWARRQLSKNRDAAVVASELLQGGLAETGTE